MRIAPLRMILNQRALTPRMGAINLQRSNRACNGPRGSGGREWVVVPPRPFCQELMGEYHFYLCLRVNNNMCTTGPFLHTPKVLWLDYAHAHNCVYYAVWP